MMTNDKITISDATTGETIEREMTDQEQAQRNAFLAEIKAEEIAKAQADAAKIHERTALLERLGITQEEAALLLGGN
jgi:hypothetical protein